MAIGKTEKDIFAKTTTKPTGIGLEVTPRTMGRPPAAELYQKVTVCLYDRQTLWLDRVALAIREKTRQSVNRAELVRAILDKAAGTIDPGMEDFDQVILELFPLLDKGNR